MGKNKRTFLNEPFTQEMLDKFESELIRLEKPYFKRLAQSIYQTAQVKVPVRSGNLRDSAFLTEDINYSTGEVFSIKYDTPSAYALHEGKQVTTTELEATGQYPYKAYTKSYIRKDGTAVGRPARSSKTGRRQAGYKLYEKYYKPTKVNGAWYSINQASISSKLDANGWLQKAWDYVLSGEDSLANKLFPKKITIKKN